MVEEKFGKVEERNKLKRQFTLWQEKQVKGEILKEFMKEIPHLFFGVLEEFISENQLWSFTRVLYSKLEEYAQFYEGDNYSFVFDIFKLALEVFETNPELEKEFLDLSKIIKSIVDAKWIWLGASPSDQKKLRPHLNSNIHIREAVVKEAVRMEYIVYTMDYAARMPAPEEVEFFLIDLEDIILDEPFQAMTIQSLKLRLSDPPDLNTGDKITAGGWLKKEPWGFTLVGVKKPVRLDGVQENLEPEKREVAEPERVKVDGLKGGGEPQTEEAGDKSRELYGGPRNFRLIVKTFSDDVKYARSALVWLNMTKIKAIPWINQDQTLEKVVSVDPLLLTFEGVNTISAHVTTYKSMSKKSWIEVKLKFELQDQSKTIPLISKTVCTREETPTVSFKFTKDYQVQILSETFIKKS